MAVRAVRVKVLRRPAHVSSASSRGRVQAHSKVVTANLTRKLLVFWKPSGLTKPSSCEMRMTERHVSSWWHPRQRSFEPWGSRMRDVR